MLRINDLDSFISKARNVTIIVYFVIIKSVVVENDIFIEIEIDLLINRISSLRVVIFVKKELITSSKKTFFIKETSFIEIFRIVIMNEYRSFYINIINVIVFAFFKMKEIYNIQY